MRRIPISMVTPDMILAKDIWRETGLLLAKGIDHIERFREKLVINGVSSVYIEDGVSEDIYCEEAVCENTRVKCNAVLNKTLYEASMTGRVDMSGAKDIIANLVEELFSSSDVLLSMSDIGASSSVTFKHSIDTTIYALYIGKMLGFSIDKIRTLGEGTLLHDIGKVALNQDILYKTARLTSEEKRHVQEHTVFGYKILKEESIVSKEARTISLLHHERLDGTGYPYGLKEEEIPVFPRIVAIADVYDALTSERCYKPAMTNEKAVKILLEEADTKKLDPNIVTSFADKLAIYPNGIIVLLSDGQPAIVKKQNKGDVRSPIVRIIGFKNQSAYVVRDCDLTEERNLSIVKANICIDDLGDDIKRQFAV